MTAVHFTPLARIPTANGEVLHGLKASDGDFAGFGEAYFSTVDHGAVKGWKQHQRMVMNLVVPVGCIRFVALVPGEMPAQAFDLGPEGGSYGRLTVMPGTWLAFQGRSQGLNLLLNVASILHDPAEAENRPISAFAWDWHS